MAYTNSTPNYHLPQILGEDKIVWTDLNPAFSTIDTAMMENKTLAQTAQSTGTTAGTTAGAAMAKANANASDIEGIKSALGTLNAFLTNTIYTPVLHPLNSSMIVRNSGSSFQIKSGILFNYHDISGKASANPPATLSVGGSPISPFFQIPGNPANLSSTGYSVWQWVNVEFYGNPAARVYPTKTVFVPWGGYYDASSNLTVWGAVGTNITDEWENATFAIRVCTTRIVPLPSPLPSTLFPTPIEVNFNDMVKNVNIEYAENVDVKDKE